MILSEKIKLIPIDASTEPDIDGVTYRIDAIAWTWRELVMRVGTYDLVEPDGYEYDATLRRLSTGAPGEIKKMVLVSRTRTFASRSLRAVFKTRGTHAEHSAHAGQP